MYVISRKPGDSVMIDDNIEVTIVQIKDDKVRLGITTPKDIPVHRKEVHAALTQGHDELTIGEVLRELEATKAELEKYKSAFYAQVKQAWDDVEASDLQRIKDNPFDLQQVIKELESGQAA